MDDASIQNRIEALVAEEHQLQQGSGEDPERHERLQAVKVELDRAWDLLRQRRGQEEFGQDPDQVLPRDPGTIEHYQQ